MVGGVGGCVVGEIDIKANISLNKVGVEARAELGKKTIYNVPKR